MKKIKMKTPQEARELLYTRFRVKPKLSNAIEIYNHLTGNDGEDKNEYGDVVITAVWNMSPWNFLYDFKYIDFWYRSRDSASEVVAKYMDRYYKYAKKHKIDRYTEGTSIEDKGLGWS